MRIKPQNIIAKIDKNLKKKKWECLKYDCTEDSINSHLVQQNGILNNIAFNNHLIELDTTDANHWGKKVKPYQFKRKGIKQALSYPLFCNKHDSEIFKPIESDDTDFENYHSFLLFSYRAVCSEIRKKEINIELYNRILNSKILSPIIDKDEYQATKHGNELGVKNLIKLKSRFEDEIHNPKNEFVNFTYSYEYQNLEIYASAVFSGDDIYKKDNNELKSVFVHILPLKNKVLINIGYDKSAYNDEIIEYCQSWKELNEEELQLKLTGLLYKNIENWGISIKLFDSISKQKIDDFIDKMTENIYNYGITSENKFNIFK